VNNELEVCPEDPVEAFFTSEQEMVQEQERLKKENEENNSPFRKGASCALKQLVKKHKKDIHHLHPVDDHEVKRGASEKQRSTVTNNAAAGEDRKDLWGSVMTAIKKDKELHEDDDPGSPRMTTMAPNSSKISAERKEACQMLRFFVFGTEQVTPQDVENLFCQQIGTKDQVRQLFRIWSKLDDDDSGRVDVSEFRAFAEKHFAHKKSEADLMNKMQKSDAEEAADRKKQVEKRGTRHQKLVETEMKSLEATLQRTDEDSAQFITRLCEKVAHMLLGKKSSFAIEDMMRVIWPSAELPHIKLMKGWCRELKKEAEENRVNTPPVIDNAEIEALRSVFEHFCEDGF